MFLLSIYFKVSLLKIGSAIESPYPFKGSITPGFFCFDPVPRHHRKTWFVGYLRGSVPLRSHLPTLCWCLSFWSRPIVRLKTVTATVIYSDQLPSISINMSYKWKSHRIIKIFFLGGWLSKINCVLITYKALKNNVLCIKIITL